MLVFQENLFNVELVYILFYQYEIIYKWEIFFFEIILGEREVDLIEYILGEQVLSWLKLLQERDSCRMVGWGNGGFQKCSVSKSCGEQGSKQIVCFIFLKFQILLEEERIRNIFLFVVLLIFRRKEIIEKWYFIFLRVVIGWIEFILQQFL